VTEDSLVVMVKDSLVVMVKDGLVVMVVVDSLVMVVGDGLVTMVAGDKLVKVIEDSSGMVGDRDESGVKKGVGSTMEIGVRINSGVSIVGVVGIKDSLDSSLLGVEATTVETVDMGVGVADICLVQDLSFSMGNRTGRISTDSSRDIEE
jgi:hypothetical protein